MCYSFIVTEFKPSIFLVISERQTYKSWIRLRLLLATGKNLNQWQKYSTWFFSYFIIVIMIVIVFNCGGIAK